jgi:hypothetical protein
MHGQGVCPPPHPSTPHWASSKPPARGYYAHTHGTRHFINANANRCPGGWWLGAALPTIYAPPRPLPQMGVPMRVMRRTSVPCDGTSAETPAPVAFGRLLCAHKSRTVAVLPSSHPKRCHGAVIECALSPLFTRATSHSPPSARSLRPQIWQLSGSVQVHLPSKFPGGVTVD